METQQSPQSQSASRVPRRRLIQGSPNVRPSPPAEMAREYSRTYRRELINKGIPDRRLLAEAIMQSVLEDALIPVPQGQDDPSLQQRDNADRILNRAAALLMTLVDRNEKPIYNPDGIRRRLAKVSSEMQSGIARRSKHA